jgi:hypothetical protein
MAIGNQSHGGKTVTSGDLKDVYGNVIREALVQARPDLEIIRSDEVSAPGTITTDILTRLMHSNFVVADITHPNPNVFYELGIRHACKPGTILIRDAEAPDKAPFDVSQQRYIEYHNSPAGIKTLATDFRTRFAWYDSNSGDADNPLLSLAKWTHYNFPQYGGDSKEQLVENMSEMMMLMMTTPGLLALTQEKGLAEEEKGIRMLNAISENPKQGKKMVKLMMGMMFGGK